MQVAKALLVPNLLGVSHTGETGSFAQSQTQLEAFFWTLQADTKRLEDCITEQLIADLCARNPAWGVRDLEAVDALARAAGFGAPEITEMPANNLCVAWRRLAT